VHLTGDARVICGYFRSTLEILFLSSGSTGIQETCEVAADSDNSSVLALSRLEANCKCDFRIRPPNSPRSPVTGSTGEYV
jgi:hypothetical protein